MIESDVRETVRQFVTGEMDVATFKQKYDESDSINNWLQGVIDDITKKDLPIKRRTIIMQNVNQDKPFQVKSYVQEFIPKYAANDSFLDSNWRKNPPPLKKILGTIDLRRGINYIIYFFGIVADIYYQVDPETERTESYSAQYLFLLDVLPRYLDGGDGEEYVAKHIIPQYPESMGKGKRKKAIRDAIREAFALEGKTYPRWIQSSQWPIGTDNSPMIFTGQKAFKERTEYYFKDKITGEITTETQWW